MYIKKPSKSALSIKGTLDGQLGRGIGDGHQKQAQHGEVIGMGEGMSETEKANGARRLLELFEVYFEIPEDCPLRKLAAKGGEGDE